MRNLSYLNNSAAFGVYGAMSMRGNQGWINEREFELGIIEFPYSIDLIIQNYIPEISGRSFSNFYASDGTNESGFVVSISYATIVKDQNDNDSGFDRLLNIKNSIVKVYYSMAIEDGEINGIEFNNWICADLLSIFPIEKSGNDSLDSYSLHEVVQIDSLIPKLSNKALKIYKQKEKHSFINGVEVISRSVPPLLKITKTTKYKTDDSTVDLLSLDTFDNIINKPIEIYYDSEPQDLIINKQFFGKVINVKLIKLKNNN